MRASYCTQRDPVTSSGNEREAGLFVEAPPSGVEQLEARLPLGLDEALGSTRDGRKRRVEGPDLATGVTRITGN